MMGSNDDNGNIISGASKRLASAHIWA